MGGPLGECVYGCVAQPALLEACHLNVEVHSVEWLSEAEDCEALLLPARLNTWYLQTPRPANLLFPLQSCEIRPLPRQQVSYSPQQQPDGAGF